MNTIVVLILTIALPVAVLIGAGVWHRTADLIDELRAFDVEGIHFDR